MDDEAPTLPVTSDAQDDAITFAQTVPGVEVMRVGTWNGHRFTLEHLEQMVQAAADVGFVPPVKLGHDDDPKAPAYGWVRNLRVKGETLVCDFTDVPDALVEEIKQRRYDQVSAEVWKDTGRNGKLYPRVLKAVAILGAHPPGVSDLKPLSAALDAFGADAAALLCTHYQEDDMKTETGAGADGKPTPTEIPQDTTTLQAQVVELQRRLANMEDAGLKIQKLTEQVNLQARELELTRKQKTEAEIEAVVGKLKVPALRPHVRALMTMAAEARDATGQPTLIKFAAIGDDQPRDTTAVAIVRDMIDRLNRSNEHLFSEQSSGAIGDRDEEATDTASDPSQKVVTLAQAYASKHQVDLVAATTAVLADPANARLARAYATH
jgi:hypothetical protein